MTTSIYWTARIVHVGDTAMTKLAGLGGGVFVRFPKQRETKTPAPAQRTRLVARGAPGSAIPTGRLANSTAVDLSASEVLVAVVMMLLADRVTGAMSLLRTSPSKRHCKLGSHKRAIGGAVTRMANGPLPRCPQAFQPPGGRR